MFAARWYGARDIRLEQVARPTPGARDALVRIERVGLCGSDVEQFLSGNAVDPTAGAGDVPQAMTLGHELVGVVEECLSRPSLVGTRVIPDVVEGCGSCWWCLRHDEGLCPTLTVRGQNSDGGLAEYFVGRAARLVTVPEHVTPDVAAFAEPVSVAVRALEKCGDLRGGVVAIVGLGVIGNLIAQVCRAQGITVVGIDVAEHRTQLAEAVGVVAVEPAAALATVLEASGGRGADAVFECAGRETTFAQSFELCRSGGTVVLVGIADEQPPFPWRDAVLREIRVVGTAAHMWDTDVQSAVNLLASGTVRVDHLHSRTIALSEVSDTLLELAAPNQLAKVLVNPAQQEGAS